jgi:anti-anti-sigma factor
VKLQPEAYVVDVVDQPSGPILKISGEIDIAAASQMRSAIDCVLDRSQRLVLDLSEVTFMDSTGLNLIAGAYRRLGSCPERIVLRKAPATVLRVLAVSGVDRLVTIEPPTRITA